MCRRLGIGCVCVFFFQAEDGIRDDLVTGVQTCALPIPPPLFILPIFVAAAPPLFILTNSRCGSAPDFYIDRQRHSFFTARISLRLRPCFLYCPYLLPQSPRFLYCTFLVAAAPFPFILTISRCGSDPAIYTAHFSLRQRPCFLYCPFLVAAKPPLFIDRKSTRLNSSHQIISYAVFCLKKKKTNKIN